MPGKTQDPYKVFRAALEAELERITLPKPKLRVNVRGAVFAVQEKKGKPHVPLSRQYVETLLYRLAPLDTPPEELPAALLREARKLAREFGRAARRAAVEEQRGLSQG